MLKRSFSRFEAMVGQEALVRLSKSHVMVIGVGGVGGGAVEALARSGVGMLTLIDDDCVDETNLNRQFAALSDNIGMRKVEAMAQRVRAINPDCIVKTLFERVNDDNAGDILSCRPDFVADCIDDMNAKVRIVQECRRLQIPLICSMGAGNRLDVTKIRIVDLFKTQNDPVARIMRRRLRELNINKLTVAASEELPGNYRIVNERGGLSPASSAFVPPAFGFAIAGHIVRTICSV